MNALQIAHLIAHLERILHAGKLPDARATYDLNRTQRELDSLAAKLHRLPYKASD